jgi:hypothetical protein
VESKPGLLPETMKDNPKAVKAYIKACIKDLASTAKDGWYGGVYVFHGWRRKGLNKETQAWETIEDDARDDKYIRTKWYWSPHVHFIVYGFFLNEGHFNQTGFIQKVIVTEEDPFESVRKILTYLLTHSGIWLDNDGNQVGQAYRYFGKYAPNKGGRKFDHKESEAQFCEDPECKCHLDKWTHSMALDGCIPDVEPRPIPVFSPDVPIIERRRAIRQCLNPPRKPIIIDIDPIRSWERDPHDIMHGWACEPYVIERKVYVYLLAGEKST